MQALTLPMALLATVLGLGGLAVLYVAWRRPGRSALLRGIGWGLFLLSVWPWGLAGGADRGVALGMVVVSAGALALIAATGQWRGATPRRQRAGTASTEPLTGAGWGHWLKVFLLAGPLAAVAAFVLALPLMHLSGWAEADRLVATAFAVVILWSAGAVWACATPRLMRVSATMAGLTAAGTALLLVL